MKTLKIGDELKFTTVRYHALDGESKRKTYKTQVVGFTKAGTYAILKGGKRVKSVGTSFGFEEKGSNGMRKWELIED